MIFSPGNRLQKLGNQPRIWAVRITCLVLVTSLVAGAQEKTPEKEAAKAPPATQPPIAAAPNVPGPAAKAYAAAFEEWKRILADLRNLKQEFDASKTDANGDEIKAKWAKLIEEGNQQLGKIRATGLEAYKEAPNADAKLTKMLVKLTEDAAQADNYSAAAETAKELMAGGNSERALIEAAAVAAYGLNNFDESEALFAKVSENKDSTENAKKARGSLDAAKAAWESEQVIRKAEAEKDDLPRVKFTTNKGVIVLELYENEAPDTVGNFISLVEKGYYDGLAFHRVLPGFMAQGGDPKGDGSGGPGYNIFCECKKPEYRRHFAGCISMAHAGPDTGGSQFFLTFQPVSFLDGRHTCFGRIVEGMDVLAKIQRRDPSKPEDQAIVPDKILKAEVLRKREHEYAPRKVS